MRRRGTRCGLPTAPAGGSHHSATIPLQVVILEKNPSIGGNSARASSGINAVNPAAGDSEALFVADTLRSGGGLSQPALVERLAVGV